MQIRRDPQHHDFTLRMPFREFVNLNAICEAAIARAADENGFARRFRGLVRRMYESETVKQPAEMPLVILGPGGTYQRNWPGHTTELIGGNIDIVAGEHLEAPAPVLSQP